MEEIRQWGNTPWRGAAIFSFSGSLNLPKLHVFFTFLLVADCFVDNFEFSSEWHIVKFDSAFDTLYGRPSFLRNGRVFGVSVFLMDGGWGERAGPSLVFSRESLNKARDGVPGARL